MSIVYNHSSQSERRKLLRQNSTGAEKVLWDYLRAKKFHGFKFRRQFGIGYYIVDFYCPEAKLVIELDGSSHEGREAQESDIDRQKNIEALGIKVIRFTNTEVFENIDFVLEQIKLNVPPYEGGIEGGGSVAAR